MVHLIPFKIYTFKNSNVNDRIDAYIANVQHLMISDAWHRSWNTHFLSNDDWLLSDVLSFRAPQISSSSTHVSDIWFILLFNIVHLGLVYALINIDIWIASCWIEFVFCILFLLFQYISCKRARYHVSKLFSYRVFKTFVFESSSFSMIIAPSHPKCRKYSLKFTSKQWTVSQKLHVNN